ncbi:MAG TPA: tRNA lysidine(34) synthetase TilS, partial [Methylophilaceae bacterium]|nr:tRNA lysidine(34) synthetase TilS [Methylophilaceae bacterium]
SRARNLLRWWLDSQQQPMPSSVRLDEMLRQLLTAREDAGIKIAVAPNVWLRRYRNLVYLEQAQPVEPFLLKWQGETELTLPDSSTLKFEECSGQGLALKHLESSELRIASRQGGERFRPDHRRPQRTLKHLLQEAGMPPWQREHLPLVYCNDKLAFVPGIGAAAALQAVAGEPGLVITWQQR